MEILFLGTSCMQPTKERNHPGFVLSYGTENILFDCGENIQRQMRIAGIKPAKITKILISHWHGDHVLGLPGIMQTMGASQFSGKLVIYGPKGTKENLKKIMSVFAKADVIEHEIVEITKSCKIVENDEFILEAYELEHGIETYGFKFIEKDKRKINMKKIKHLKIPEGPLIGKLQKGKDIKIKKEIIKADDVTTIKEGKIIGYIADTVYTSNCLEIAQDCDLLISESSFTSKHKEKAEKYKHLTAEEAASIANQCNVKKLVLTHFSQRYKDSNEILEDAKKLFQNVVLAYDFMKVKI